MSLRRPDLVIAALRDPTQLTAASPATWDLLIRQSRSADLLARIASLLHERELLETIAPAARAHLLSARTLAIAQQDEVRREVAQIACTLCSLSVPVVLLKGAAYLLAGLPAALGRTFADVDILVPRSRLAEVEAALMLAGWATTHHSEYDQRYYRQWMHELPPLQHVRRQTILDVHHAILPVTARLKPDSRKLLLAALALPVEQGLHVLAPVDMVLHSMTHLFHNEEMGHGLRDLSDLDRLLRHFATTAEFWNALVERAAELNLSRPLYYGLHQTRSLLGTPVEKSALTAACHAAPAEPLRSVMNWLWSQALGSPHVSTAGPTTGVALFALYVRAHWLRMPPALLLRHLAIKAVTKRRPLA